MHVCLIISSCHWNPLVVCHNSLFLLLLFCISKWSALSTSHNSKLTEPWLCFCCIQRDLCKEHTAEWRLEQQRENRVEKISSSSGDKCWDQDLFVSNAGSVQQATNNSLLASCHHKPVIKNSLTCCWEWVLGLLCLFMYPLFVYGTDNKTSSANL